MTIPGFTTLTADAVPDFVATVCTGFTTAQVTYQSDSDRFGITGFLEVEAIHTDTVHMLALRLRGAIVIPVAISNPGQDPTYETPVTRYAADGGTLHLITDRGPGLPEIRRTFKIA